MMLTLFPETTKKNTNNQRPRALAAAEVYWTGRGANGDEVEPLDQRLAEALPRLHDMRFVPSLTFSPSPCKDVC